MLWDVPRERYLLTNTPVPESEANLAKRTTEQASVRVSGRQPSSSYWLLVRNENGGLEALVTDLAGGEEALLVFSHKEEAEMFLSLGHAGFDVWQARETTAGELLSVLYGPCAGVERVALDPLPEMLVERTIGLVSLSWERFVDLVLGRERPLAQGER